MAVVFISPKKKQRTFFWGITIALALFLIFVALWVFLSKPAEVPQKLVFNKAKVNVDMSIFNSDQFKNLEIFPEIPIRFSYTAIAQEGGATSGYITAASRGDAEKLLEKMGFVSIDVKDIEIGRDNPFAPSVENAK
jgi:predicted tellurium resistance membrane protein TerC